METNEIEELNPLQVFLLVLVEFGLSTPYDLLSKAGMGPGLTSPALKRLQEAGLLTSTPGPRKRLRYAITEKGGFFLKSSLRSGKTSYWRVGQMDVYESLPRGIILAWLHAGVDEAHRGAVRAGVNLATMGAKKEREAEELRSSMLRLQADILNNDPAADQGMLIATAYQWLKALCDAEMFMGQAQAIGSVIRALADLPPAPPIR
jgi:DNA-binding PadR family transcriptional regulator